MVRQIAQMKVEQGPGFLILWLPFPQRKQGLALGIGFMNWRTVEGAGHEAAPPFGSTGAVYSREALAAPWHAPHTTSPCMCIGLPLQLKQDAKSVIVCL